MKEEQKNKFNLDILNNTINDLINNKNACILSSYDNSSDFIIGESIIDDQLNDFFEYLYDSNKIDVNYSENYKKIKNKSIESLTYNEILTRLTFIHKADRFCSGSLYEDIKSGLLLQLLQRLNVILKDNI